MAISRGQIGNEVSKPSRKAFRRGDDRPVRMYSQGGSVAGYDEFETPLARIERELAQSRPVRRKEPVVTSEPLAPAMPTPQPPLPPLSLDGMPFGVAFATARKNGDKIFTWNGKPYTTELAGRGTPQKAAPSRPSMLHDESGGGLPSSRPELLHDESGVARRRTDASREVTAMPDIDEMAGHVPRGYDKRAERDRLKRVEMNIRAGGYQNSGPAGLLDRIAESIRNSGPKSRGEFKGYANGGSVTRRGDGLACKGGTKGTVR